MTEQVIRLKEKEIHNLFVKHKDGTKSPYQKTGYVSEDAMLADFMTWAKNTYPCLRKSIFHIENEGDSSSQYARMKGAQSLAKGKLKGVFDVCCVYKGKMCWAEFKLKDGVWSSEQKELHRIWHGEWDIPIVEIRCFDDWKTFIDKILKGQI